MLDQLFMHEASSLDLQLLSTGYSSPKRAQSVRSDGLARVRIEGVLMAGPSRMDFARSTDTGDLTQQLLDLQTDPSINRVLLEVASPGGQASGIEGAAEAVRDLAKIKPVFAVVQSIAASAAYWIVSQASKIFVSRSSLVGSIGTVNALVDVSGMLERVGIKYHVVRSAPLKAIGEGAVTPEQLAEVQRIVDELTQLFIADVSAGRNRNLAKAATGQVWMGADAVKMGLADAIGNSDVALRELMATKAPITLDQAAMAQWSGMSFALQELEYGKLQAKYGERIAEICPRFSAHFKELKAKQSKPESTKFRIPTKVGL